MNKYKQYILEHLQESKESALVTTKIIQESELNAGNNNYTRTLQIPKFFTLKDKQLFQSIVDTTYSIFCKVIQAYRNDEAVRNLFPFSKELEHLILLEPRYQTMIPICRIDIFFNEDTKEFKFCEFNTDGTSAMNENARMNEFLQYNNVIQNVDTSYEIMELLYTWVHTFIEIVRQDQNVPKTFHMAIVDIIEHAYLSELKVYEKLFNELGYSCELIDMRQLEYKEGKLYSKKTHKQIDVIYRRAVTKDIMDYYDEIQPMIQAILDQNVCTIGAFQTHIVHHKEINKVLMHPTLQQYLSKEDIEFVQSHLPKTYDLTSDCIEETLSHKDRWIIKPKDGYASKGVWTGIDCTKEDWKKHVFECVNTDYLVQEFITPYKSENIDLVNYDTFQYYSNLTGLYCFDGKFAGVYSRLSDAGIISSQYNEKMIPTLFIKEED